YILYHNRPTHTTHHHSSPTRRSSDLHPLIITPDMRYQQNASQCYHATEREMQRTAPSSYIVSRGLRQCRQRLGDQRQGRHCEKQIGRAHVRTPVTVASRMPSSA